MNASMKALSVGLPAAAQEGYSFVGSEMMAEYVEIAYRRIAKILPGCDVVFSNQPEETPVSRNAS
ncbi:hypothetical protein [Bosea thiooxidans]|uniref:hypothetical protein n=1 Tax=Bosea thiooxidans TaxID=53254 RepID=UPI0012E11375|nr:hypothetical protein [Bosea thiooxidans]